MEEKIKVRGAIVLPEEISSYAVAEKRKLVEILGAFKGHTSVPVITLFDAECRERQAAAIAKITEQVGRSLTPFVIRFDHFGEFFDNRRIVEGKTIYIGAAEASEKMLSGIRRKLSAAFKKELPMLEMNMESGRTAHITIALGLNPVQSATAEKYMKQKKYEAEFQCMAIVVQTLVKKTNFTGWQTITTAKFSPPDMSLF